MRWLGVSSPVVSGGTWHSLAVGIRGWRPLTLRTSLKISSCSSFLRKGFSSCEGARAPGPYLLSAARNRVLNLIRHEQRRSRGRRP
jgi:hypothetical protein